jgi:hypothetical protein
MHPTLPPRLPGRASGGGAARAAERGGARHGRQPRLRHFRAQLRLGVARDPNHPHPALASRARGAHTAPRLRTPRRRRRPRPRKARRGGSSCAGAPSRTGGTSRSTRRRRSPPARAAPHRRPARCARRGRLHSTPTAPRPQLLWPPPSPPRCPGHHAAARRREPLAPRRRPTLQVLRPQRRPRARPRRVAGASTRTHRAHATALCPPASPPAAHPAVAHRPRSTCSSTTGWTRRRRPSCTT